MIGALLPALIRDAQVACRAYAGDERRQAQAVLTDVLGLTQMFLAYQPAGDLLWRTVDRAAVAAQESDDPVALATAVWFGGTAHRDAGDWDTAMAITTDTLQAIKPALPDASDNLLAMWGALQVEASHTAARAGEAGRAWHHLDIAQGVARRLPAKFFQRTTSFSRALMSPHAVTVEVELRKGGQALREADRTDPASIPSRPRRARHLIEVARGHHLRNDPTATIGVLNLAYETAPETIRYNGHARSMVLEMLDGPPGLRRSAHDLAAKVGLLR